MISSFQSTILLIVVTHTLSLEYAGIFSFAFANAYMFQAVGLFGMRNYQTSDVKHKYSFYDYCGSRLITALLMVALSVGFVLYLSVTNAYTVEKSLIVFLMCILRLIDAIEDVVHGFYQQNGRLDVAGRALTIRVIVTFLCFMVLIIVLKNLLAALIATIILGMLVFALVTKSAIGDFLTDAERKHDRKHVFSLLKTTIPVFLGLFLSIYLSNAPKYAIDGLMDNEAQAYYNFLSTPAYIITLLNSFIYNPIIYKASNAWHDGESRVFYKIIFRQFFFIVLITAGCVGIGYLIGIPVLTFIFGTNLAAYKTEFILLLVGGGFWALTGFLVIVITIIRFQKSIGIGYILVSAAAFFTVPMMVETTGLTGAAHVYLMITALLSVVFAIFLIIGLRRKGKKNREELAL
jgi:O-antigen/teichoic acid export membrane protein